MPKSLVNSNTANNDLQVLFFVDLFKLEGQFAGYSRVNWAATPLFALIYKGSYAKLRPFLRPL